MFKQILVNSNKSLISLALVLIIIATASDLTESKLLRHSRFYEPEPIGPIGPMGPLAPIGPPLPIDGPFPAAGGERAIVTVRGVRHPYDGSAPAKITIEDQPYSRGPYPRGVYDRLDGYGGPRGGMRHPRGEYPYGSGLDYMGGYGRGYNGGSIKRRDFLDPDFGFKASLNLASQKRSKCRLNTEADSEIPELGLDSGRVNVDCDVNPARVADAAVRVARTYGKYRRDRRRQRQPQKSSSQVKRKRTRINIDTQYERQRGHPEYRDNNDYDEEADDD